MRSRLLVIAVTGLLVLAGGALLIVLMQEPAAPPPDAPIAAAPTPTSTAAPTPTAKPSASKPPPTPTPEAAPTTGTLIVESDVPDTSVFIDRVYVGIAPVTAAGVAPGSHRVNASAAGYDGIVETIDVAPGTRTLSVKFKEVRLDAMLAVVHKHAIGSCSGTLRATPKGLTYDTVNKEDAFTVALTGLDAFAVDYLQKNLRVKIKNGKTYNFTDPEGKADRLYLFHGEVEKARQRILTGR